MITNLLERNGSFRSGDDAPVLMIERRGDRHVRLGISGSDQSPAGAFTVTTV
jgi:hypothetical protein